MVGMDLVLDKGASIFLLLIERGKAIEGGSFRVVYVEIRLGISIDLGFFLNVRRSLFGF